MTKASDRCQCRGMRCTLLRDDNRHGTCNGYGNHNCRCVPCRKENTRVHAQYLEAHPEQRKKAAIRERRARGSNNSVYPLMFKRPYPDEFRHGCWGGVLGHRRADETLCTDCMSFMNWRARVVQARRIARYIDHGTWGAYRRHLRDGETACDKCLAFVTERTSARKKSLPQHESRERHVELKVTQSLPMLARLQKPRQWKKRVDRAS